MEKRGDGRQSADLPPFMEIKMYIKRILSDLHISRKPLPFCLLGLQLIQLSAVFQTEISESKQWRKHR